MPRRKKPGPSSVSAGGLRKKTFWLSEEEEEHLRKAAFDSRRSQNDIVRSAVRVQLGIGSADDLADVLTAQLAKDPDAKDSLRELFEEYSDGPEEAEELMRALAGGDE